MTVDKRVQTLYKNGDSSRAITSHTGSSQPAQSSRGSTATPGSSSMLSYTRETLSETITNTVHDGGGIATRRTTIKLVEETK